MEFSKSNLFLFRIKMKCQLRYNGHRFQFTEVFSVETQKLYEEDVYKRTFRAQVLSCKPVKGGWQIVLDRTAFYPEGGGQPGDCGVLDRVNVLDTHEKEGTVLHLTDAPLPLGKRVTGGINWPLRRSRMQEHTGEHILSGVLHRFFGVNNVGFHMGSACVTLDLDKPLTADQIALGERLANEAVYQDLPVQITYPTAAELKTLDYRSKKELTGQVRIVTIPGYDVCACCGTHVSHTGEIGLIKVIGWTHYKGGVRISLLCGSRALRDYGECLHTITTVSSMLSAKPKAISDAVSRLLEEKENLQHQMTAEQNSLFQVKAETAKPNQNGIFCTFETGLEPDGLRRFSTLLAPKCSKCAAVFSGTDGKYQYAVASVREDVRAFGKSMNAALNGRGGGKSGLVQGSVQASQQEIKDWFVKQ
ncbi:MAG TPA: alanyl-tRNA editing protein [Ruminococcaceae bacterium]|jgi:alanyl-tRNA synthetase|nr:alanyl-tRNA editing protein [Oscillospiraceae bacterium]HCC01692.1 alanyl-tRNA editing protein [Oscillospiraceae bacterium]HCM24441.1 alanyl-tRNA editing protein [Oscillospiraceae bacterium]